MSDKLRKLKDKASKYHRQGKDKDALKLYLKIIEQEPKELSYHLKIGDIRRRLGDLQDAVASYERVASAYAEDGLLLKAIAVCKMILSINAQHESTVALLGTLSARRASSVHRALPGMKPVQAPPAAPAIEPPTPGEVAGKEAASAEPVAPQASGDAVRSLWPAAAAPSEPAPSEAAATPASSDEAEFSVDSELPIEAIDDAQASEPAPGSDQDMGAALSDALSGAFPVAQQSDQEAPIELTSLKPRAASTVEEQLGGARIPLFSDLPKSAFIELLIKMDMHEFEAGDTVVRQGDIGSSFFVLVSGKVRVARTTETGESAVLAYLTDGAFFGEMAILQGGPRTASVIADESSQIFEISKDVLDGVVEQYPVVHSILRNFYRQRLLSTVMATHPLFRPFARKERRELMEMFQGKDFAPGKVLLEEGAKGSALYLVLSGKLTATTVQDGDVTMLGALVSGDVFGEMSLLKNEPVSATITAEDPSYVLRLGKKAFDQVIMTHPHILEVISEISSVRSTINETILHPEEAYAQGAAALI